MQTYCHGVISVRKYIFIVTGFTVISSALLLCLPSKHIKVKTGPTPQPFFLSFPRMSVPTLFGDYVFQPFPDLDTLKLGKNLYLLILIEVVIMYVVVGLQV